MGTTSGRTISPSAATGAAGTIEHRIDHVEWCSLSGVPRRMRFPFQVKTAGWIVVSNQCCRNLGIRYGTEFCVRMAASESAAVDTIDGRTYRTPFPHVVMKRFGAVHDMRHRGWREAFFVIYPPALAAALRRAGADDGPDALPVWPVGGAPDVLESIREMRALFARVAEPGVADELDARCW
ncbi:MAG: hypothetical protein IJS46_06830, partial [Kiritimatiellae bacterium]|nr:hypothetical protein [Kiritimatiellia bacterium]